MDSTQHVISWKINTECDFRCSYCYGKTGEKTKRIDILNAIRILRSTGKDWLVRFTGGEPFLHPDFIDLCVEISRFFKITIDTNLSNPRKIRQLIKNISPDRISFFSISLHIEERERLGTVNNFIETTKLLTDKGYSVQVGYVLHPLLISRFEKDYITFEKEGIHIEPRPFKGKYHGKSYPESYSDDQWDIIKKYNPNYLQRISFKSKGLQCGAGKIFIRIWPDGSVTRCHSERTLLGNICTRISLYDNDEPCKSQECECFGRTLVSKNLHNMMKFWLNEKYQDDFLG